MVDQELLTVFRKAMAVRASESFDGDIDYQKPLVTPNSEAAVLVLVNLYNEPSITLTKRQSHMRRHAGQVAFPGGRKDDGDLDLWATAIREAEEEIGLPKFHPIKAVGELNIHNTITGFRVTPCLAFNEEAFPYQLQKGEVSDVFELPLHKIKPQNFHIEGTKQGGIARRYYVINHDRFRIWGATARILRDLSLRLEDVGYF